LELGGLPRNFPIFGTEQGLTGSHSSNVIKDTSVETKALYVAGITALQAALGWKMVTWYSHDDELCGNPSKNPRVAEALDWCSRLGGKRLTSVSCTGAEVIVRTTSGMLKF
jgi:hypothetical protein